MGCQTLAHALKQCGIGFEVVAAVTTCAEILQVIQERRPKLALISSNLQDGPLAGFKILDEIRTRYSGTNAILMLDWADSALVMDGFRRGARGIAFRSDSFESLCEALCRVHIGDIWASNGALQLLIEGLASIRPPLRVTDAAGARLLTDREEEVVALVAEGLTNREISGQLHLSEHTVKNYLFHIFEKLGISSRVSLILYVTQRKTGSDRGLAA